MNLSSQSQTQGDLYPKQPRVQG